MALIFSSECFRCVQEKLVRSPDGRAISEPSVLCELTSVLFKHNVSIYKQIIIMITGNEYDGFYFFRSGLNRSRFKGLDKFTPRMTFRLKWFALTH